MKLSGALECYHELSAQMSNLSRQLAMAALAVVWIFKSESTGRYHVASPLIIAAALAVLSLACDFMQYAYGRSAWGFIHRHKEKQLGHDQDIEFHVRREVNWPSIAFFWTKGLAVLVAYGFLLSFLIGKFSV